MVTGAPPLPTPESFYVTGGTLRQGAASYVERDADRELTTHLRRGDFCYVLTSRQMGKSSLMVHTAARLRADGFTVVVLDLTAIGQNLTAEQWYDGLLGRMGAQLGLEDELEDYWDDHPRLGPMQRWMAALQDVVLPSCQGPIVVFVDEIDTVRSLPFSTDEFFAGIRECYNRRAEEPDFRRLTFCLLGVATPSDLIQDSRITPFNIGHRIDLTDFTDREAAPLAKGLGRDPRESRVLLKRILYWTGGHPYLTQRLCQAVAEMPEVRGAAGVDRLCEAIFLTRSARERDDNLLFVRERLLKSEADRASLLDLYHQVRTRRRARDDETNPLVVALRLSGIIRLVEGYLWVRNRIYFRVFDREWVLRNMPDAEVRRQRAAFRQGLARSSAITLTALAVVLFLLNSARTQASRADRLALEEARQRRQADRLRYVADVALAQQAWDKGAFRRAADLLAPHRPPPGRPSLGGFEWRYLWRLCQCDPIFTFRGHGREVRSVAFSPDGKLVASGSDDTSVRLLDVATRKQVASLRKHRAGVTSVAFSPDGLRLVSGSWDNSAKLWDVRSGREARTLLGHEGWVQAVAFSGDGRRVVTGSQDKTARLWDAASGAPLATMEGHTAPVTAVRFSPTSSLVVTGSLDRTVRFWDGETGKPVGASPALPSTVHCAAFSPKGERLAVGLADGTIVLLDAVTRRPAARLLGHRSAVQGLAFGREGRTLISASWDQTIRRWDLETRREVAIYRGHRGVVTSVALSPDGSTLASGSHDWTVRLWSAAPRPPLETVGAAAGAPRALAHSSDGRLLALGGGDRVARVWDSASRRLLQSYRVGDGPISRLAFTPQGEILAAATGGLAQPSRSGTVRLWSLSTGKQVAALRGHRGGIQGLGFLNGDLLVTGGSDGTLRLWSVAERREVARLDAGAGGVRSLAVSRAGALAAVGGWDGTVSLWSLTERRQTGTLRGHTGSVLSLTFSPDGRTLASGGEDGTLRLWSSELKTPLAVLESLAGPVTALSFAPDGQTLAAGCADATIRLWDTVTRRETLTLKGHQGAPVAVEFSPDAAALVSAGPDRGARVWRSLSPKEAARVVRGEPMRLTSGLAAWVFLLQTLGAPEEGAVDGAN